MVAGLEHYEKYGLGGDTINELNQRALKAHKPMIPSLPVHLALLRKTCGNTQKSRWACRGCQYIGECK